MIRPTWEFDQTSSYLVVGGLGGIGRSILKWMASRGARYLIAPSRSGAKSATAAKTVKELQEKGVNILTPKCDAASWESLCSATEEWSKAMPAIRGCINAAMALNVSFVIPKSNIFFFAMLHLSDNSLYRILSSKTCPILIGNRQFAQR